MSYETSWEPRGVLLCFSGDITIRDILNASVDYEKDCRFDDLLYVIADYSQITSCNSEPEHIDDVWVVDTGAKLSNRKIKKAIVTTNLKVISMAKRYKESTDSPFPVEIFTTEAEARKWLDC